MFSSPDPRGSGNTSDDRTVSRYILRQVEARALGHEDIILAGGEGSEQLVWPLPCRKVGQLGLGKRKCSVVASPRVRMRPPKSVSLTACVGS
jgi:hypothetical protein